MFAGKVLQKAVFFALLWVIVPPLFAQTHFIDLSKACNRGLGESFDEKVSGIPDLEQKNGLKSLPVGNQTFRGIPFQVLGPDKNQGRSLIALKGRHKPDFPEGVSISAGNLKAPFLYFLHTCRWGGTAPNITVAEYDIVYEDGQVMVIPLRVGVELTNFFGSDDTSSSYLAWWHKYKNTEMGVNLFPWKNPRPDKGIQSIIFKSRGSMPVPILLAITASDKELVVSTTSPKPEKIFQTDTSKWIPFEPSNASPVSTAIDMSFLLDAPAGKHGKVKADGDKLVFEDGTPARFWGVQLPLDDEPNQKTEEIQDLVNRLIVAGCNVVLVEGKLDKNLLEELKANGIYTCFEKEVNEAPSKTPTPDTYSDDPSVFDSGLLKIEKKECGIKLPIDGFISDAVTIIPTDFIDTPMVMNPSESLPLYFSKNRIFEKPFGSTWLAFWPNEYLAEVPLLISSYANLNGWAASFGMIGKQAGNGFMNPFSLLFEQPQIFVQWPIAALAYLRGDLKEGKVFVLDKDSSPLKVLAHKSGINPEGGKFKTDVSGQLKAKVNEKTKSFVSDTGQITWQGNVGVVKVETPRFQALIGFLAHRKFNNPYWAVETPNEFASLSAISLTKKSLSDSDHLLLTGVTRMENTGMVYNAAKTKLLDAGKAPILVEPLNVKIVLYRFQKDPKLKVRALDVSGHPLKARVLNKWVKNNLVISWLPSAFYLEIFR